MSTGSAIARYGPKRFACPDRPATRNTALFSPYTPMFAPRVARSEGSPSGPSPSIPLIEYWVRATTMLTTRLAASPITT